MVRTTFVVVEKNARGCSSPYHANAQIQSVESLMKTVSDIKMSVLVSDEKTHAASVETRAEELRKRLRSGVIDTIAFNKYLTDAIDELETHLDASLSRDERRP